ncbi:MAG: anhydro-N-acetylmuramic acid kinase [Thermoplasmata archaeon]
MKIASIVSGTSADGLTIGNIQLNGYNLKTTYKILKGYTIPYSNGLRSRLLKAAEKTNTTSEEISKLNWDLGLQIADSMVSLDMEYDLISYSGHTIYHGPSIKKPENATLQIGEISILVSRTGKTAISDYRMTDMAYDGLGAPLIAISDYILFRDSGILTLNIGGIANITYLGEDGPIAFDTGPGNMLIDQAMYRFYGTRFDENGTVASRGNIVKEVLSFLMNDRYIKLAPPKNSGREYYGIEYLSKILKRFPSISKEDLIRTITRFTAESIYAQANKYLPDTPKEVIVGGGGSKNKVIMSDLGELFTCRVSTFSSRGIEDELRESLGFAILANQTLHHAPGRLTDVKTMSGPVLGKITPGTNFRELFSFYE